MKNLILISIVLSLILTSLLARSQAADPSRIYSILPRIFTTACSNFAKTTGAGFNSSSQMASMVQGRIDLVTAVYKQKNCRELGRIEYSNGLVTIKDGKAIYNVFMKSMLADEALSAYALWRIDARLPNEHDYTGLPVQFTEYMQEFKNATRITYAFQMKPAERVMNLSLDRDTKILELESSSGTIRLTRDF